MGKLPKAYDNPFCKACLKKQIKEHGKISIECRGFATADILKSDGLYDEISPIEEELAKEVIDPIHWAAANLVVTVRGEEGPWRPRASKDGIEYQAYMLRCTAKRRALRLGRRTGKTESIAVSILYDLVTTKNYKIILVTPYLTQINEILERVERYARSGAIGADIKRYTKTPIHYMRFTNGSSIKAYPAGAKGGASIRSASANKIYIDEGDYLDEATWGTVMPILNDFPDTEFVVASTPSGRKARFYKVNQDPSYKVFHYPSYVIPHWNEAMDKEQRRMLTTLGYKREICFAGEQLVYTANRGDVPISDIVEGDMVVTRNSRSVDVLSGARATRTAEIFKYVTSAGDILCTPDHKFPNRHGRKQEIGTLSEVPVFQHDIYSRECREEVLARLVGYNLGDGTVCSVNNESAFYSNNLEDMEELAKDLEFIFPEDVVSLTSRIIKPGNQTKSLAKVSGDLHSVRVYGERTKYLLSLGCVRGKKVEQEFDIPEWIKKGSLEIKRQFISALYGAEGSTPRRGKGQLPGSFSLSMSKRDGVDGAEFFNSLVSMLGDLGIKAIWTVRDYGEWGHVYVLYITSDYEAVLNVITPYYDVEKQRQFFLWKHYLAERNLRIKRKADLFQTARDMFANGATYREIKEITKMSTSQVDKAVNSRRVPKRLYGKEFQHFDKWVNNRVHNGVLYIPILSTEFVRKDRVFNITVGSDDHSYFLANGVHTFNCAEFGESEVLAVQHKFLDLAIRDYQYHEVSPHPSHRYTVGVDWNSQRKGTRIVVLEVTAADRARVVEKHLVDIDGWTQLAAIDKILEVNRKWNPCAIYIDEGYGGVQKEVMEQMSEIARVKGGDPADARLSDVLETINFSSNVSVRDPFTGENVPKHAKSFLVENLVRFFEQEQIIISKNDEELISQIQNYGVLSFRKDNGLPIYGAFDDDIGDHDFDALMLALAPITLDSNLFSVQTIGGGIALANAMSVAHNENKHKSSKSLQYGVSQKDDKDLLPVHNVRQGEKVYDVNNENFIGMPVDEYIRKRNEANKSQKALAIPKRSKGRKIRGAPPKKRTL